MTRTELVARTRQLVVEGDRLVANPSLRALQTWLQLSDELLSSAWGTMDRYHLAWLMVGKPKHVVRGRPMTPDEEAARATAPSYERRPSSSEERTRTGSRVASESADTKRCGARP